MRPKPACSSESQALGIQVDLEATSHINPGTSSPRNSTWRKKPQWGCRWWPGWEIWGSWMGCSPRYTRSRLGMIEWDKRCWKVLNERSPFFLVPLSQTRQGGSKRRQAWAGWRVQYIHHLSLTDTHIFHDEQQQWVHCDTLKFGPRPVIMEWAW